MVVGCVRFRRVVVVGLTIRRLSIMRGMWFLGVGLVVSRLVSLRMCLMACHRICVLLRVMLR